MSPLASIPRVDAPRAARREVPAREGAAELALVGAEVAEVVAGPDAHLAASARALRRADHRHDLEHLVGLEEQVGLVRGAPHGHGDLHLPGVDPGGDELVEERRDLAQVGAARSGCWR